MELTIEYETQPAGAVLVHSGRPKEDDGGAWRPLVFQIGAGRYQSGVIHAQKGSRPVVHRAILDDLSFARRVADELARLAAA